MSLKDVIFSLTCFPPCFTCLAICHWRLRTHRTSSGPKIKFDPKFQCFFNGLVLLGKKILLNPLFFMIFVTHPKTRGPVVVLFQCSLQPIRGKLLKWCGYGRISQGPPWSDQSKIVCHPGTSLEASTLIECVFVCSLCAWAKTASCLI